MLRQAVLDVDESSRVDLTRLAAWAVDSAETTEVDDAVSCEDGPEGRKRFWVHIADPTRWLQPGSPMDEEAARRTTSMYLPTGTPPSLTPLSNLLKPLPYYLCCNYYVAAVAQLHDSEC